MFKHHTSYTISPMTRAASYAAARLKTARLEFSQGNLESAQTSCREILAAFPEQTGALHLLGILLHNQGSQAEAADLLRRAAEAPDATALYLLTYAEMCCKGTDVNTAIELARHAVAIEPQLPLAWFYLGSLLMETRRLEESRSSFERTLMLEDNFWQARVNLAVVLSRQGDRVAASKHYQRLLREEGDNAEVAGHYAAYLRDEGRYDEALVQAQSAITLDPQTLDHYLRAAEIDIQRHRYDAALARLDSTASGFLRNPKWLALKAHLLRLVDRYDEAIALCRGALVDGIESADIQRAYGLALHAAGESTAALDAFDRAVTGNAALALSDKGILLAELGRLSDACAAFDAALVHDPACAQAWYNKSNVKSYATQDPEIVSMRRILDTTYVVRDRLLLDFALGKAHMDAGDTTAAFAHWDEGNRLKRASLDYDGAAAARRLAAAAPEQRSHAIAPNFTDAPVFIVGIPRCGSTLVEQILASHPEVCGAGELAHLRPLFAAAQLGESCDESLAELSLARLRRFSPQARRIIDKDLGNFLHLGIINQAFPRARIIHCRRDPLDTCFSAYSKLFAGDYPYTYELRELGQYYREYHALMGHWRCVLPAEIFLDVDYESLVADPAAQSRRLLDFLGLPWAEECARFFETERVVNTASFLQVRRPIYRSSVGRARSVKEHLLPLIDALGGLAAS